MGLLPQQESKMPQTRDPDGVLFDYSHAEAIKIQEGNTASRRDHGALWSTSPLRDHRHR